MNPFLKVILLLSTVVGSSCTSMPSPEQASQADYGSYPSNYESIVKIYYNVTLKDPDSAKFGSISTPIQYYLGNRFSGAKYGYLVCSSVNAKNSYGAYVGYKTTALLIRNGEMIKIIENGIYGSQSIC